MAFYDYVGIEMKITLGKIIIELLPYSFFLIFKEIKMKTSAWTLGTVPTVSNAELVLAE